MLEVACFGALFEDLTRLLAGGTERSVACERLDDKDTNDGVAAEDMQEPYLTVVVAAAVADGEDGKKIMGDVSKLRKELPLL